MAKPTKKAVKRTQRAINAFNKRQRLGHAPLRVDGQMGRLTRKYIRNAKFDLGYLRSNINVKIDPNFRHRLRNPTALRPEWGQSREPIKRGRKRRTKRRLRVVALHARAVLQPGIGFFDGRPVAKAAIPYLVEARRRGWKGTVVSGYRTPAYSESLCYRMCGRPSCPGRCAGRATNHAWALKNRFAVDVSDYANFGRIVQGIIIQGQRIHNVLGSRDPVHFSPSGR